MLNALDIFGLGLISLFSVLLSVNEEDPLPRPVPLDPAPDIELQKLKLRSLFAHLTLVAWLEQRNCYRERIWNIKESVEK